MKKLIIPILMAVLMSSCDKEFLEKKPDLSLMVPAKTFELQALLDNDAKMNVAPAIGEIASDDFYTTGPGLQTLSLSEERNSYLWMKDVFETESVADWNVPYVQVFYSNVVLDGLDALKDSKAEELNTIRGHALFCRALAFYNLAQLFCAPYNEADAARLPGIPLKLSPNIHEKYSRGSVKQVYEQIIMDLGNSVDLLPLQAKLKTRPSKAAALALLARVYLSMEKYEEAEKSAVAALQLQSGLIDFNTLSSAITRPLPAVLPYGNEEVLYYNYFQSYRFLSFIQTQTRVDSSLYASMPANDLRKAVLFNNRGAGVVNFKSGFTGSTNVFAGLAVNELYLIRAECRARKGDRAGAMSDLNALLIKRWKKGTFVPLTAGNDEAALRLVLQERRKELFGRGQRWEDLRRLNKDPRFAVTLTRNIDGTVYSLAPQDKRYIFPIPLNEIKSSGIAQNER